MRLKVTGYIDTDNLPSFWVDPNHESGLTGPGFEYVLGIDVDEDNPNEGDISIGDMEDVEIEKEN